MINNVVEKNCENSLEDSCFEFIPIGQCGARLEGKVGCAVATPENPDDKNKYFKERQTLSFIKGIYGGDRQVIIRELGKTILRYDCAFETAINEEVKKFFEEQCMINKRTKILYLAGLIF